MASGDMARYAEITDKNPREILLLRGAGCKWKRCTFCDYHLDASPDAEENFRLNCTEIAKVTGKYGKLEIINSGSFVDLDEQTMKLIRKICVDKGIKEIHFECHFIHRQAIPKLREEFASLGIKVKVKIGVETFDAHYREQVLRKGIGVKEPERIAEGFDEVCLLFGLTGQTAESMRLDIETGLALFERVCVNIMVENTTSVRPDPDVIAIFMREIYPIYMENDRVDILLENTDFGVGGK